MDTKLIKRLGGATAVANLINDNLLKGDKTITRQRVHNWIKAGRIPPYFKLAYAHIWQRKA